MGYYDGDPWSSHVLNEVKCAECEEYFDNQEDEGNICPACVSKSYEENKCVCTDQSPYKECLEHSGY